MSAGNPRSLDLRSHRVARAAYARVEARRADEQRKKYGALVHKLPGMILQNGLAQTTGFLLAKAQKEPHAYAALEDLVDVLTRSGSSTIQGGATGLHERVIDADLNETLLLTRRALEAAGWMKRYVQGVLRIDATGTAEGDDAA